MTELARTKAALETALRGLRELDEGYSHYVNTVESRVNAILSPPVETETVPLERWAVIAPSGFIEKTFSSEDGANHAVTLPRYLGYGIAKLTGSYQREKPQPVERSVTVEATLLAKGSVAETRDNAALRDHPECHGKTGTLTFTWTE